MALEHLENNKSIALGYLLAAVERVVAMQQHDAAHEQLRGTLQGYYVAWSALARAMMEKEDLEEELAARQAYAEDEELLGDDPVSIEDACPECMSRRVTTLDAITAEFACDNCGHTWFREDLKDKEE